MVLEAGGSSSARSGGTPGAGPSVSPVMQVNATVVVRGQAASPAASGSPVVPVRTVEQQQQRQAQHAQQIMKRRSSGGLRDTPPLPSLAEEQARHAGSAPRGRMVARTPATPGVAAPASGDANDRPALGLALDSEAVLREMQAASAGGASEPVASSPEVMPDCMRVCLPPPVSARRHVEHGHPLLLLLLEGNCHRKPHLALATAAGFGRQRVFQPGGGSIRCACGRRALQRFGASPGQCTQRDRCLLEAATASQRHQALQDLAAVGGSSDSGAAQDERIPRQRQRLQRLQRLQWQRPPPSQWRGTQRRSRDVGSWRREGPFLLPLHVLATTNIQFHSVRFIAVIWSPGVCIVLRVHYSSSCYKSLKA